MGLEVCRNIPEDPVFQSARLPVQHQKSRGIPGLYRCLRDQLFRQIVIKFSYLHGHGRNKSLPLNGHGQP